MRYWIWLRVPLLDLHVQRTFKLKADILNFVSSETENI